MSTIFVSHSSLDQTAAGEVHNRLRAMGHASVFLDSAAADGIPAGHEWERVLYRELKACRAVVVVHSANWLASRWGFVEAAYARALGKHIFPVLIDDSPIDGLLTDRQAISLLEDPDTAYARLADGLVKAGLDPASSFSWTGERSPYPGLDAFDEDHAAVFFGREEEIGNGLDPLKRVRRLGTTGLMMILGPSGSGKSSLVRAGLIPRLRRDPNSWIILDPIRPLDDPARELAAALARAFQNYGETRPWPEILHTLQSAMADVIDTTKVNESNTSRPADDQPPMAYENQINPVVELGHALRALSGNPRTRVIITIDQFEELLGHTESDHWARFLALVRHAIEDDHSPVLVLGTMRSDFLEAFQANPALVGIEYIALFIGPMSAGHIAQIIKRPAEMSGIEIDDDLVQAMVIDTTSTENALPLLAFTLRELHERCGDDMHLELTEYNTELGGLDGAIANTAEAIVTGAHLSTNGLADLRTAFLAMARLAEEGKYTKRIAKIEDIPKEIRSTLDRFEAARLLVIKRDSEGAVATYEVRHDAIFRSWHRLVEWLNEDIEELRLRRDLNAAAGQWIDGNEGNDRLWSDARISRAGELIRSGRLPLDEPTTAFVERAAAAMEQERRARDQRRKRLMLGSIVVAAIMAALAAVSVAARNDAERSAELARSRAIAARATETIDERPDLAFLLALEGLRVADTREARDSVLTLPQESLATAFLRGHSSTVEQVAWDEIRNVIASVDSSGVVALWDSTAIDRLALIETNRRGQAIAISAGGSHLAVATNDGVLLWNVAVLLATSGLGSEPTVFLGGSNVTAVAFDARGELLAIATDDFSVGLFDTLTGEQTDHPPLRHQDTIRSVRFSPDGRSLVTASADGDARVWDLETGAMQALGHNAPVREALFSPGGDLIATGADDHIVRVWNLASADAPMELDGHTARVRSVAFSADGEYLASAGDDQSVIVWEATHGTPVRKLVGHTGLVTSVAFGLRTNLVSAGSDETVIMWEPLKPMRREFLGHTQSVRSVEFSSAGATLVSIGEDGRIIVWDPKEGAKAHSFEGADAVDALALSPDDRTLATSGDDPVLRLWVTNNLTPVTEYLGHTRRVWGLAYSIDGRYLASSGDDGTVLLTELASGDQRVLHQGSRSVRDVAFGASGLLAWGNDDGSVTVWDLQDDTVAHLLTEHSREVWAVAFSPDGRWVAAAGNDEVVLVWDTTSGDLVAELSGATQALRDVTFNPSGETVAAAGQDGSVLVWATNDWRLINRIDGQAGRVWTVAFHPTQDLIASGGVDGAVVLWQLDLAEAVESACRIAARNMSLEEWRLHTGGGPYVRHCSNQPAGKDAPIDAPIATYPALGP